MSKPEKKQDKKQIKAKLVQQYIPATLSRNIWYISGLAFILSLLLYCNTIHHEYALDDMVSITQNSHTQNGFSGIGKLITKDSFDGYTSIQNLVSGGRYRPLALITFAIEIGFFGKNIPHISHIVNVILYALSMSLLFLVCYRFIFKGKILASALSCALFIVHPLHTEVVANIKSRDEILSLLFGLGTIYCFLEYLANKNKRMMLILAAISFFLAMLSKENAVLFIVFIPLLLYFFYDISLNKALKECWLLIAVLFVFLFIRFSITGLHSNPQNEILNAPYLFAKPLEAFATKVYILLRYLLLLLFPHPLSCIYTWNAIPYVSMISPKFIISFLVYAGIIYYGIKGYFTRKPYSFFILNYLAMILLVSNFVFEIGALMGDRFLYQAGFPVILAGGFYFDVLYSKYKNKYFRIASISVICIILMVFSIRTVYRNVAWKNDDTIAIEDRDAYDCAHLKANAAGAFFRLSQKETNVKTKDSLLALSHKYSYKSLQIYPHYIDGFITLGSGYFLIDSLDSAVVNWDKAFALNPQNQQLISYFPIIAKRFYERAQNELAKGEIDKAAFSFKMAMKHDPLYLQLLPFYYDKAVEFFVKKDFKKTIEYLETYMEFKTDNVNVLLMYGDLCYSNRMYDKAKDVYTKALQMQPENKLIVKQLMNIEQLTKKE